MRWTNGLVGLALGLPALLVGCSGGAGDVAADTRGADVATLDGMPSLPDTADTGSAPPDDTVLDVSPPEDTGGEDVPLVTPDVGPLADCTPPDPLLLQVALAFDECSSDDLRCEASARGAVTVVAHGPSARGPEWRRIAVQLDDEGGEVVLDYALPYGWRLPAEVGEHLEAGATLSLSPQNQTQNLYLREEGGRMRASIWEGSFNNPFETQTCGPVPWDDCRLATFGTVSISATSGGADISLGRGSLGVLEEGQDLYRAIVGEAVRFERFPDCDDRSRGRLSYAILGNHLHSQCRCFDDADCAPGAICERELGRCVERACEDDECETGICDPYYGCTVLPPSPQFPCAATADCADTDDVCNPHVGYCQPNPCVVMDCPSEARCSPLLGRCVECLHDCDCPGGTCDPATESCFLGCDMEVLDLTRENPQEWDYYVICIEQNGVDPGIELREIDPTIQCGAVSNPACAGISPASCQGELDFEEPGSVITAAKWTQLCEISQLVWIHRIVGAHRSH